MRHKLILLCWILALSLTAALLISNRGGDNNIKLELPDLNEPKAQPLKKEAQKVNATSSLLEPRFTGHSKDGREWDIRAQKAIRRGSMKEDEVLLNSVTAKVNTETIEEIGFNANSGLYKSTEDSLTLNGNVHVKGYNVTLSTPTLTAQLDTQELQAGSPILLEGAWKKWQGTFTAPTLTFTQPGPVLTLTGGVKGHLQFKENQE